jgi:beta-lactamase class A
MVLMAPLPPLRSFLTFSFALCLASFACAPLANAQAPAQESQTTATGESSARPDVEQLIQQSGADVSIAFRSLDGSQQLLIHADRGFDDSLAMKIPIMIDLFAQADARQLKFTDTISVHNSFRSVADDSTYGVDPSFGDSLAPSEGQPITLSQLCDAMITRNSDIAANLLIERLGLASIQDRIHALGADGMVLASGFGDKKAAAKGLKNVATPRALMTLLLALSQNSVVSADASQQMVGLLAHSTLPGSLAAGYVAPVQGAHPSSQTGQHDAAIILGARPFVLVTDVRGIDASASAALVARIAHALSAAI